MKFTRNLMIGYATGLTVRSGTVRELVPTVIVAGVPGIPAMTAFELSRISTVQVVPQ